MSVSEVAYVDLLEVLAFEQSLEAAHECAAYLEFDREAGVMMRRIHARPHEEDDAVAVQEKFAQAGCAICAGRSFAALQHIRHG